MYLLYLHHPVVDLTMEMLRKRKRSWNERLLWLTSTNELPSTPSCIRLLPHERAPLIDDFSRSLSPTLKREG